MACPSGSKGSAQGSSLEQLIEEINFQRAKEMRQLLKDDSGFVMLHGTAYWTDLFVRHFLMEEERTAQESDDLLFFIRKRHLKEAKKYVPKYETLLEVQRRDSKKLPIGDPEIDWEETIYANLIIHRFDYYVTLAVCTRTSPKELQVLRRHTERVWASPSRRLMSDKGTSEEITYPNICFMLDNFDEAFTEIVVRDGEMVSVELVARDRTAALQSVIFLGSVRYDALRRVYDARTSLTSRVAQRMTFGLYSGADAQRMEFVRVRGPMGKGHAELAVTKPPGVDCESPTSEPGCTGLTEQAGGAEVRGQCRRTQRRASDPSGNFNNLMKANLRMQPPAGSETCSEDHGPLDLVEESVNEIEAGDPRDGWMPPAVECIDPPTTEEAAGGVGQVGEVASGRTADVAAKTEDEDSRALAEDSASRGTALKPAPVEEPGLEGDTEAKDSMSASGDDGAGTELAMEAMKSHHAASASAVDGASVGRTPTVREGGEAVTETETPRQEGTAREAEAGQPACDRGDVGDASGRVPSPGDPPGLQAVAGGSDGKEEDGMSTVTVPATTVTTASSAGTTATAVSAATTATSTTATSTTATTATTTTATAVAAATTATSTVAACTSAAATATAASTTTAASTATASAQSTGGRRASCSDAGRSRPGSRPAVITPGMLYRRTCGQSGAQAAAAARCACARTPDGTVVHYRCHVQQAFLRQRELDDGVCNPIWTMRGFSQTFHFWKETKRTSSLPLNTYLTYVMLPWHTIISDLIAKENRQDPILSF